MLTTVGQLLVNEKLPEELRDNGRVLTNKDADELLGRIAHDHPEKYREISHHLVQVSREAAYAEGATLGLSDMLPPIERKELFDHVKQQTAKIMATDATEDEKQRAIEDVYSQVQKKMTDATYEHAVAAQNPFALQVLSKARGNPSQLAALMTTPGLYTDAEDKIVPTFITHSYAEGLRPHEFWAGLYGARKSILSTKFATRQAGYLGKQFQQAVLRLQITKDDCGTQSGVPVNVTDHDSIGAVLARPAGKFPSGSVVSKEMLASLKADGTEQVLIRSPITCGMGHGLCKQCVGHRETGDFPRLGDHVGINAASALAERLAQGSLNQKHSGGMKSDTGDKQFSGFDVIESFFQTPHAFPNRAAIATVPGKVEEVEPAPQGGTNITIGGKVHYALPDMAVKVKKGDEVEAGDQLSDGILNPREVVEYKGLGEGRRYIMNRALQAFKDTGYSAHRRNMEVLTRGVADSVRIDDPRGMGNYLPGDIASYNAVAESYVPRKDAQLMEPTKSVGRYLEQPVMHHTIGTPVSKRVAKEMEAFGHTRILTHQDKPQFTPQLLGLRAVPQYEEDWMAQLGSSYLKTNLLENAQRGAESHIHGQHPVPAIARGTELAQHPTTELGY